MDNEYEKIVGLLAFYDIGIQSIETSNVDPHAFNNCVDITLYEYADSTQAREEHSLKITRLLLDAEHGREFRSIRAKHIEVDKLYKEMLLFNKLKDA